jgi:hypothetical protein
MATDSWPSLPVVKRPHVKRQKSFHEGDSLSLLFSPQKTKNEGRFHTMHPAASKRGRRSSKKESQRADKTITRRKD